MRKTSSFVVMSTIVALAAAGCVVKNDKKKPDAVTAAQALTNAVAFEGGKLVDGLMPDPDDEDISLISDDVGLVDPGDSALMTFDVTPADSEVEAALIQFKGSESHFLIDSDSFVKPEADGGTQGRVQLSFEAGRDVCDKLCDTIYDVEVIQAVRLRSGDVSKHGTGTLKLDCSGDGKPEQCTGDEGDGKTSTRKDASTGGDADASLTEGRDSGAKLTPMEAAFGACDAAGPTCNGMDEYLACVMTACDAEYQRCFGEGYQSGDYSGSTCETYANCFSTAPDPCNADCVADEACDACMNGFTACAQECISMLDCSNVIDGGGPIVFPDAGALPDLTGTCDDLDACCATLSGTEQEQCTLAATQFRSFGGDIACSSAIATYCP